MAKINNTSLYSLKQAIELQDFLLATDKATGKTISYELSTLLQHIIGDASNDKLLTDIPILIADNVLIVGQVDEEYFWLINGKVYRYKGEYSISISSENNTYNVYATESSNRPFVLEIKENSIENIKRDRIFLASFVVSDNQIRIENLEEELTSEKNKITVLEADNTSNKTEISKTKTNVGDLNQLTTTAKSNLVGSINELNNIIGSLGGGFIPESITPSSSAPTVTNGYWAITQPGTYTNFGNVVLPENNFGFIFKNGNNYSIQSVELPKVETLTANISTQPNILNHYITTEYGVYTNFDNIEVWNEQVIFSYNGNNWIKKQVQSFNNLSPKYNEDGLTTESNKFMKYIKSINLVQGFDVVKDYFISDFIYKNGGYTGIVVIIKSLPNGTTEFVADIRDIELKEGKPILLKDQIDNSNKYISLELSKYAPNSLQVNGTYYQDSFLNKSSMYNSETMLNRDILTAKKDTTPTLIEKNRSYLATENGVYTNFNNIEVWNEQAVLNYDLFTKKWKKEVYDAGDFAIENDVDSVVGNNIRKIVQNIKLVEGFDMSKQYFISSIKYKDADETGIYLLLKSLPSGAYEFETRIQEFDLIKGNQILLEDRARGRKVLLTISNHAPATFSQAVVYYQDSLLGAKAFHDANYNAIFKPIKTTRVKVSNNNDFAIRTLVHSLKASANYYNRYVVVVPRGTYFEMDIRTGDFIDIEGVSAEECIINLDGLSSKIAPYDLSIGEGGIAISLIDQKYKHIFWHVKSSKIRNLTLQVNDCKYAIHSDAPGEYSNGGSNLILVDNGNIVRLIGIGGWAGQKQSYKDCYFKNKPTTQAVGWHNWNNQPAPATAELINCKSDNYFINLTELGSGQADVVRLVNCTQVSPANGGVGFYVEPQDSTAPDDVAYNIKLVFEGKELPIMQINRQNYKVF